MKTLSLLLSSFVFLLFLSCNKKESKSDETNLSANHTVETVEKNDSKNKDCDDFLDDYEKWMDDLVTLFGKYKDRPVDLLQDPAYSKTLSEGVQWSTAWMQQPMTCLNSKTYQKRFEAIQERAKKKMEEIKLK